MDFRENAPFCFAPLTRPRPVSVEVSVFRFAKRPYYPGCPSRSDSSDEMSELDDSEVDDISKDDDELLFLAKRFFDLLPVPANTK